MPALFDGVMQRAISAGSERVAGQLSGRKDNTEQRAEGKKSQKHLFRQLGVLYTDEERRLRATIRSDRTDNTFRASLWLNN